MKKRFEICRESMIDPGNITREVVKTFRNEGDAIAFYRNPRNARRYSPCVMLKHDQDGNVWQWNERGETWEEIDTL